LPVWGLRLTQALFISEVLHQLGLAVVLQDARLAGSDYSKTEIAEGTDLPVARFSTSGLRLEAIELVVQTREVGRAKMYMYKPNKR